MRQVTNLRDPLPTVEHRLFFRFNRLVVLFFILVFFLYLLSCGAKFYQHSYEQKAKQSEEQIKLRQAKIKLLEQRQQNKKKRSLGQELTQLREIQAQLEQVLGMLNEHVLYKKSTNYTAYLDALAKKPSSHLWFTSIEFQGEHISLEGITTDAEELPRFLFYLNGLPLFKKKSFSAFDIRKTKSDFASQATLLFKLGSISK